MNNNHTNPQKHNTNILCPRSTPVCLLDQLIVLWVGRAQDGIPARFNVNQPLDQPVIMTKLINDLNLRGVAVAVSGRLGAPLGLRADLDVAGLEHAGRRPAEKPEVVLVWPAGNHEEVRPRSSKPN